MSSLTSAQDVNLLGRFVTSETDALTADSPSSMMPDTLPLPPPPPPESFSVGGSGNGILHTERTRRSGSAKQRRDRKKRKKPVAKAKPAWCGVMDITRKQVKQHLRSPKIGRNLPIDADYAEREKMLRQAAAHGQDTRDGAVSPGSNDGSGDSNSTISSASSSSNDDGNESMSSPSPSGNSNSIHRKQKKKTTTAVARRGSYWGTYAPDEARELRRKHRTFSTLGTLVPPGLGSHDAAKVLEKQMNMLLGAMKNHMKDIPISSSSGGGGSSNGAAGKKKNKNNHGPKFDKNGHRIGGKRAAAAAVAERRRRKQQGGKSATNSGLADLDALREIAESFLIYDKQCDPIHISIAERQKAMTLQDLLKMEDADGGASAGGGGGSATTAITSATDYTGGAASFSSPRSVWSSASYSSTEVTPRHLRPEAAEWRHEQDLQKIARVEAASHHRPAWRGPLRSDAVTSRRTSELMIGRPVMTKGIVPRLSDTIAIGGKMTRNRSSSSGSGSGSNNDNSNNNNDDIQNNISSGNRSPAAVISPAPGHNADAQVFQQWRLGIRRRLHESNRQLRETRDNMQKHEKRRKAMQARALIVAKTYSAEAETMRDRLKHHLDTKIQANSDDLHATYRALDGHREKKMERLRAAEATVVQARKSHNDALEAMAAFTDPAGPLAKDALRTQKEAESRAKDSAELALALEAVQARAEDAGREARTACEEKIGASRLREELAARYNECEVETAKVLRIREALTGDHEALSKVLKLVKATQSEFEQLEQDIEDENNELFGDNADDDAMNALNDNENVATVATKTTTDNSDNNNNNGNNNNNNNSSIGEEKVIPPPFLTLSRPLPLLLLPATFDHNILLRRFFERTALTLAIFTNPSTLVRCGARHSRR